MIGPPVAKLRADKKESIPTEESKDNTHKTKAQEEEVVKDDLPTRIQKFLTKHDSLYLSASKIAACAGLNPWSNLPKMVLELIYQGRTGRELLLQDADNIGLSLETDEEILTQMAEKAGSKTLQAFKHALKVKPKTIQEVEEIQKKVKDAAEVSKKLKPHEAKALEEGVRHAVNTGFGTMHEDDVLDLYEVEFGWDVRERNAVIREWHFIREEDVVNDGVGLVIDVDDDCIGERSVVPLRPATEMVFKRQSNDEAEKKADGEKEKNDDDDDNCQSLKKRKICNDATSSSTDETISTDDALSNESTSSTISKTESISEQPQQPPPKPKPKPFFSILGAVDGIRDELIPITTNNEEEDEYGPSFTLQQVVIECKHRMRKATLPPPLYDQIQAVAYCFMYQTTCAEIVQALRNETTTTTKRNLEEKPDYQMYVSKITLDDPTYNHEHNFNTIILPRLRSFVEMVYRIRSDDLKRMQFLLHVAGSMENEKPSWWFIFKECPWLKDCDTAWKRL